MDGMWFVNEVKEHAQEYVNECYDIGDTPNLADFVLWLYNNTTLKGLDE